MSDPAKRDSDWLTTPTFLLLLAAALLVTFPGLALGVHTLFYRDFGAWGYPNAIFTRDALLRGELPLWNPENHCGVPWLAQMGQWYPLSWFMYVLPMPWAANFLILAHLWFGGFGMFWLLRRWNLGSFAAAFAAFAFVFNGVSLSCTQWGHYIASLGWLPWVVGSVMNAWRGHVDHSLNPQSMTPQSSGDGRRIAFAAIASAMQVLTGTPEITILTWLFIGLLWIDQMVHGQIEFASSARRTALVILLAAGITMVQMLPFFDLLAHSQRNAGNTQAALWAMPAWGWANLVVPLFHSYQAPQGIWFQRGQDFFISYYLGMGALALAIAGIFTRRSYTAVIAVMIFFCVFAASGNNGFIYGPLKKIFPLIGVARYPVKFMLLPSFLLPLLAAFALDDMRENKSIRRIFCIVSGSVLVVAAALLYFARQYPFANDNWNATAANTAWRAGLLIVLLAGIFLSLKVQRREIQIVLQIVLLAILPLDAFTHSPGIVPVLPVSVMAPGVWQASGKPPLKPGAGRVMVSPNAEQELLYSQVTDMRNDFIGRRLGQWYNLNLLDGVSKVTGAVPLRPAQWDILEVYLYYTPGGHCGPGLANFMGVAWLTSPQNPTEWIERTNFLPMVTAGQQPVFASDADVLQAIVANDFAPRNVVYLPESARSIVSTTNQTTCTVDDTHFAENEIEARVDANGPALVVLSQSYYHLWRAFVDGNPAPLLRANLAFQAVEIPGGTHQIRWIYRDPYMGIGAAISLASLAACLLISIRRTRPF